MKVTNISQSGIFLLDLKFMPAAQSEGRKGEELYIAAGASAYLPNTSQVIRSATRGMLKTWMDRGVILLEDFFTLANGASQVMTHNFGYPQNVHVQKFVGTLTTDTVVVNKRTVVEVQFAAPVADANYFVRLGFSPVGTTGYVTAKTANGFTLNLSTLYTGTVTYDVYQGNWEDAVGSYDATQNAEFTTVTVTNTSGGALTMIARLT